MKVDMGYSPEEEDGESITSPYVVYKLMPMTEWNMTWEGSGLG